MIDYYIKIVNEVSLNFKTGLLPECCYGICTEFFEYNDKIKKKGQSAICARCKKAYNLSVI